MRQCVAHVVIQEFGCPDYLIQMYAGCTEFISIIYCFITNIFTQLEAGRENQAGPFDDRPSTDQLQHIVEKNSDMRHVTYVTGIMSHVTHDK